MILLDNIYLEEEVLTAKFKCDLDKCKGACCTFPGDLGAPVLESEVSLLEEYYPKIKKYLSQKSIDYIEKFGLYEGNPFSRTTVCINHCDCVFVYYEGDVALCAYEKAYLAGEIPFRKPISCHLFPIRVKLFGRPLLHYCHIEECLCAVKCGKADNTLMVNSVKDALIRSFGEKWFAELQDYIDSLEQKK